MWIIRNDIDVAQICLLVTLCGGWGRVRLCGSNLFIRNSFMESRARWGRKEQGEAGRGRVCQGGAECAREGKGGALWFKPLYQWLLYGEQGKVRQEGARWGRKGQGEAGRGRVRQGGARWGRAGQGVPGRGKVELCGSNLFISDSFMESRARWGRKGQGEAGRGKVRQGGAGCAREGKGGALWFKPLYRWLLYGEQGKVRQGWAGWGREGQGEVGWDKVEQGGPLYPQFLNGEQGKVRQGGAGWGSVVQTCLSVTPLRREPFSKSFNSLIDVWSFSWRRKTEAEIIQQGFK